MLNVPSPGSLGEPKIYHHLVYFTRKVVVGWRVSYCEELVGDYSQEIMGLVVEESPRGV